jgi:UPF0042 nucleotide-binding protein
MAITLITYGLSKRKTYPESTVKFDCQVLDNPPSVLWKLDGRSPDLRSSIVSQIVTSTKKQKWFEYTYKQIEKTLFSFGEAVNDATTNIVIAFYCQGGRHRSASVAEIISQMLNNNGYQHKIKHYELG